MGNIDRNSKYFITYGTVLDIANAIRQKTNTTGSISGTDFANKILSITTTEDLSAELTNQDELIAELEAALTNKAIPDGSSTNIKTSSVTISDNMGFIDMVSATCFENGALNAVAYYEQGIGLGEVVLENVITDSVVTVLLIGDFLPYSVEGATLLYQNDKDLYGAENYSVYAFRITEPEASIYLIDNIGDE